MRQKLDRSPYKHLLADEQFKLWFENMERGCVSSAQEYFKRIGNVCKTFDITPKKLAEMSEKEAGNFLLKIISHYESNGSSGSNTVHYLYALKNWWSFNDIEVRKKIKIREMFDDYGIDYEKILVGV